MINDPIVYCVERDLQSQGHISWDVWQISPRAVGELVWHLDDALASALHSEDAQVEPFDYVSRGDFELQVA